MRLILTAQLGLLLVSLAWLGRVARTLGTPLTCYYWLASLLILIQFPAVKAFVNGQESAAQFLLLVVSLRLFIAVVPPLKGLVGPGSGEGSASARMSAPSRSSPLWYLGLGLAAGGLYLARLDGIFFAAGLFALLGMETLAGRERWLNLVFLGLGTLLAAAPYIAWHYLTFGHLITVSGAIKAGRATTGSYLWFVGFFGLLASLFLWLSLRSRVMRYLFPLLCYAGGIYLYGSLVQGGLSYLRWPHTLIPVLTLGNVGPIWVLGPLLALGLLLAGWLVQQGQQLMSRRQFQVLCWSGGMVLMGLASFLWWGRFQPETVSGYEARYRAASWFRRHSPPDAVAAGWDVGVVGAFAERHVVNLDGLVSSWRYKEDYRDRGRVTEFIDESGVDFILQFLHAGMLRPDGHLRHRGVDLGHWYVLYVEPYRFTSIMRPWRVSEAAFFVFGRQPSGSALTLTEWRAARMQSRSPAS